MVNICEQVDFTAHSQCDLASTPTKLGQFLDSFMKLDSHDDNPALFISVEGHS